MTRSRKHGPLPRGRCLRVTAARVLGASGCGSGSTVGGAGTITVFTYGGDDEGASGTEFASTSYTGNAAPALLGSGKAAMQLMGSWDYANQLTNYPDFAEDDEGYTSFPDVAGGIGDPADVVGNPSNYWSVSAKTAHLSTAIAFLQYMTSETYTKSLLSGGRIPTATSTASLLPSYSNPAFGQFQYQMVQKAPSFQLSWDQALPSAVGTPLDTEVGRFFAGAVSVAQFEQAMAQTQKNAG